MPQPYRRRLVRACPTRLLLTLSSRVRAILYLAKILCIQFPLYRGVLHGNVTLDQVFVVVSNTERVARGNGDPETQRDRLCSGRMAMQFGVESRNRAHLHQFPVRPARMQVFTRDTVCLLECLRVPGVELAKTNRVAEIGRTRKVP